MAAREYAQAKEQALFADRKERQIYRQLREMTTLHGRLVLHLMSGNPHGADRVHATLSRLEPKIYRYAQLHREYQAIRRRAHAVMYRIRHTNR